LKTVILCGGRGTRLREYTEAIPKVLVEVGGRPILWHIMKGYAECQFTEFVLALGYLGQSVKQYFLELDGWKSHDLQLRLGSRAQPEVLGGGDQWDVILADTGIDTNTGGRLKRIERHVDDDTFFATYGDGVADIDHRQLLEFHRSHGLTATITVTRPRLGFGVVRGLGVSVPPGNSAAGAQVVITPGFALDPLYEEPGRHDDELLAFDNVILTPHMAGSPRSNGLRDIEELITGLARALERFPLN